MCQIRPSKSSRCTSAPIDLTSAKPTSPLLRLLLAQMVREKPEVDLLLPDLQLPQLVLNPLASEVSPNLVPAKHKLLPLELEI